MCSSDLLVFGTMAVHAAQAGRPFAAELQLLGAMLAMAMLACPPLGAAALRAAAAEE